MGTLIAERVRTVHFPLISIRMEKQFQELKDQLKFQDQLIQPVQEALGTYSSSKIVSISRQISTYYTTIIVDAQDLVMEPERGSKHLRSVDIQNILCTK